MWFRHSRILLTEFANLTDNNWSCAYRASHWVVCGRSHSLSLVRKTICLRATEFSNCGAFTQFGNAPARSNTVEPRLPVVSTHDRYVGVQDPTVTQPTPPRSARALTGLRGARRPRPSPDLRRTRTVPP